MKNKQNKKYNFIDAEYVDNHWTDDLGKQFLNNQNMFLLTKNQYKQFVNFCKIHKECLYDKKTMEHRFGAIGGGISLSYKIYKNDDKKIEPIVQCHYCHETKTLTNEDINVEIDNFDDKYNRYIKYPNSLNKIEFYKFKEILSENDYVNISFMGTGLGNIINVKTENESYDITDISQW